MASPAQAFHTAEEAALRASSALTTALGTLKLYTVVPTNAVPPYVVHGDFQILLENHDCAAEAEVFSTVHVWSKPGTPDKAAQARAAGDAIISALNLQLTVTGWTVDEWELQSETYNTDPDGSTHGRILLRYLLTEQVA